MRRILVLVFIVLVVAGCSGGHSSASNLEHPPTTAPLTPQARAEALCQSAKPEPAHLAASYPATVKDFRETTIATVGPTQTHRFPNLAPTMFGAWCWTGRPDVYNVYEVAGDGEKQLVASGMVGNPADSNGRPSVP